LKTNEYERKKRFIKELGERHQYAAFKKESLHLLERLATQEQRDEYHFLEQFLLKHQLFAHPLTPKQKDNKATILDMAQDLDYYYFLKKLKLDTALESNTRIFSDSISLLLMDEINTAVEQAKLPPEIKLYHLINRLLRTSSSDEYFDAVVQTYEATQHRFQPSTSLHLLQLLINFTTTRIGQGDMKHVEKQLTLYKMGLSSGVLLQQQKITKTTFSNIISCAAYIKDFEWVEWFMQEYHQYLEDDDRAEIVAFNRANISFKKEDFLAALDHLATIKFTNILYQSSTRVLLIECYFELFLQDETYLEVLLAQTTAFDKWMRREQKLTRKRKEQLLNFAITVKQLIRIRLDGHVNSIRRVEKSLNSQKPIAVKTWLQQKLELVKER
jgi:hypothetical protein